RFLLTPSRSPTTSLSAAILLPAALAPVRADHLPPCNRFRDSSRASHQDISIKDSTEVGTETSIEATIEVTTEGMYDHLLEMPVMRFEELEEEQKALKDREETADTERANLRERVRIEHQLGFVTEELRQSRMTHFTDRESLRRMETFLCRRFDYPLASHEANSNNGNENMNEAGNHNEVNGGLGGVAPVAKACTYKNFLNCQPRNFGGTAGVVSLARWFEKMESVFQIRNCAIDSQVKFATCTLVDGALTWWNSHVQTIGTNVTGYTGRFQELSLLCQRMVPEEEDKIERFIWGLPDNIQINITSSKPTRLQDAIKMASNLMDQKMLAYAAKNDENKRRKVGHTTRDCKAPVATTNQRTSVANQKTITCYECGRQGHYKSECLKLKNQNHGNQTGNNEAHGRSYTLGGGEVNLNSNVVTGTFLLNNRYAFIFFDSGADRSFVSTTFSSLIDIALTALDVSYAVELADGRVVGSDTIIRVAR
ncbi:reverse transcriptase domain-containing protein, partial [Tanacetum coccineum]